jgi:hypothetical protein
MALTTADSGDDQPTPDNQGRGEQPNGEANALCYGCGKAVSWTEKWFHRHSSEHRRTWAIFFAAAVLVLVLLPLFVCETASFAEAEAVCLERNNLRLADKFGGQDWEQDDYAHRDLLPIRVPLFTRPLGDPPPPPPAPPSFLLSFPLSLSSLLLC